MVSIRPFRALHPSSDNAKAIACFPYDVACDAEARDFVRTNPNSFLRVTRPEADFNGAAVPGSDAVLETAKRNLEELVSSGMLRHDPEPSVYVYRLETGTHSQTGVVACCSLTDYESGDIRKHERTRPDKVADRTAHMVALRAQTGLILLAFKGTEAIQSLIAEAVEQTPIFEFVCGGGIRHTAWRMPANEPIVRAFTDVPSLYIADGHHRIESALNARDILRSRNGDGTTEQPYDFVMAGMFPARELRILPYNRVVKDLNGLSDDEFLTRVADYFDVSEIDAAEPERHGVINMYFRRQWFRLDPKTDADRIFDPISRLDVTILQKYLLEPVLGIADPSTDESLGFVGGVRGIAEIERIVENGEAVAGFALHATTMDDLFTVSDMGEIMPPKSTWFEPKLKDGLFVHLI